MALFAGITCTFLRGEVPALKRTTEVFRVPGIDGYGAMQTGLGDSEFQVTAVLIATKVNCYVWRALIEATQGTVVSMVTDTGAIYTNCLVEHVDPPKTRTAWRPGAATELRMELTIKGKHVGA